MSSSRKIRRTRQKELGKGSQFQQAMGDLSKKMQALHGVEKLPDVLSDLEEATRRAVTLADALTDDYNTLLKRIEYLEEKTGFHYTEEPDTKEGA